MKSRNYEKATEQSVADLEKAATLLNEHPLAFAKTPMQAELMKEIFEDWIRVARLDLDLLNRRGGSQVVRLAREIINIGKGLT